MKKECSFRKNSNLKIQEKAKPTVHPIAHNLHNGAVSFVELYLNLRSMQAFET